MQKAERELADINTIVETALSMISYALRQKLVRVTVDLALLPPVHCVPVKISPSSPHGRPGWVLASA